MRDTDVNAPLAEWRTVKLRDIAARVATRNTMGNANVLTISAAHGLVSQEEFFNRRVASADLSQYYLLSKGDFAYNKSYSDGWPVGVVRSLERYDAGVVSPLYICFRPDPTVVHSSFLQHYFNAGVLDDDIQWIAKEGVRNHGLLNVGVEDFFNLTVKLPPPVEQQRIAEILDEVDAQITATRALLKKEESIQRGSIELLFKSGLLSDRELRQSPLGELPEPWGVASISDICSVGSGTTPPRSEADLYYSRSGTSWVKTLDLNEGILWSTDEQVTASALRNLNLRVYPKSTVLVAMYGGWAQIGRTALLGVPAAVNQAVCALEVKDVDRVLPAYLMAALQQGRIRWRSVGVSTRKDANITKGDVEKFLVPIPELDEQRRIAEIVSDISQRVNQGLGLIRRLELFKKSVLGDLAAGRVRFDGQSAA
ncbi:restriction endonuclease subunit S [Streptomyces sp. NPDC003703]|uniref:restriction endonuclease subunit S n=1 Tax=Streptomyces sp. NPDC003283 TaxID=3364681 RepID=UPI0036A2217D